MIPLAHVQRTSDGHTHGIDALLRCSTHFFSQPAYVLEHRLESPRRIRPDLFPVQHRPAARAKKRRGLRTANIESQDKTHAVISNVRTMSVA